MRIQLLLVPYDSGYRDWRMGCGPAYLLRHGAGSALRALGHTVDAEYIDLETATAAPDPGMDAASFRPREIASSFALYGHVARRVRELHGEGAFPIVLGGNCGVTLGAVAAAPAPGAIGVVWLDAHGDFNTPETTTSGFLDGMALAVVAGRCWRGISATVPGFAPIPERHVILGGVRDLDPAEEGALEESEITIVEAATVRRDGPVAAFAPALDRLRERVARVHLHVDLDVLDATEARANAFASPGGLTRLELAQLAREVAARFSIVSAAFTSFDPEAGDAPMVLGAAAGALEALASAR